MAGKALARWGRYVDRAQSRPSTPCRSLMVAVLETALEDARDFPQRSDAVTWVASTDRWWPFSFENICEMLDIDPGEVRRLLQQDAVSEGTIAAIGCVSARD